MDYFYTLLTFARRRALSTLHENDAGLVTAGIDAASQVMPSDRPRVCR